VSFFDAIVGWFTNAFDKLFGWLGFMKKGFEFVVNSRAAMTGLIIATVKGFYDAMVAMLDEVLAMFQAAPGMTDPGDAAGGVGALLSFGNCIFPISETLQVLVLLMELWLVCLVVKLKFKFLPRFLH